VSPTDVFSLSALEVLIDHYVAEGERHDNQAGKADYQRESDANILAESVTQHEAKQEAEKCSNDCADQSSEPTL
jgi:hypothetical protein